MGIGQHIGESLGRETGLPSHRVAYEQYGTPRFQCGVHICLRVTRNVRDERAGGMQSPLVKRCISYSGKRLSVTWNLQLGKQLVTPIRSCAKSTKFGDQHGDGRS